MYWPYNENDFVVDTITIIKWLEIRFPDGNARFASVGTVMISWWK